MANLTVIIDDDVLKRARMRALDQGTSVNAIVRTVLESYAGPDRARTAAAELVTLSRQAGGTSGPQGRAWTRDELHHR